MLGLSYLGQAPVAGIGVRNFYHAVEENFDVLQPHLGENVGITLTDEFSLIQQAVNYINTQVVLIKEIFTIAASQFAPQVKISIRQSFQTAENARFLVLSSVQEFLSAVETKVDFIRQIFVREYFFVGHTFDILINGIKKLWERCFTKRGEF